jgi:four helix bundle protein
MGAAHFKELTCWQLSNELKKEMYALIATSQARDDRDFCSDARRSARSAPANISEGFGRATHRDFAHFLSIATASLMESENHLQDALDAGWLTADHWGRLVNLAQQAQKTTSGLRAYLLRTPDRPHRGRRRA